MKVTLIFFLTAVILCNSSAGKIKPSGLTCENMRDPQVVGNLNPELSWINTAEDNERGQFQTAWEIRVASSKELLSSGKSDLWKSGKVVSGQSFNIKYGGKPLVSGQDCWWQVRVWDRKGKVSEWSKPAAWSMGLLKPEDWKAHWIGAPWQGEEPLAKPSRPKGKNDPDISLTASADKLPPPAPLLRKSFIIDKEVASAKAYVTGLGYFEFYLNGSKVGNDVLVPNLTLYGKRDNLGPIGVMIKDNFREYRVFYLAYDIGKYLKKGENVAGAILGNGFYNPASYWCEGYGTPRFIGQIQIKYKDGTGQTIISDQSWKASKSPLIMDLVYDGEHYDARLEKPGWCNPGFDDSKWINASIRKTPYGTLTAHLSPTDKVMESLRPVKIEKLGEGHFKIDFGEEISGWIHIMNVSGEAGRKIDIKYLCESPVGFNSYIMKGGEPESYSARFTWFVFREAEVINWPGNLDPDQIRAEAVYTETASAGHFECSNPLFNTINKIWRRSQTDNMHGGVASDCPHRERSPYTGDGQVSCATVMDNFDARAFYTKWIRDILGNQNPETGYVPNGAPWQPGCGGGVAWGAAMDIMPWEYYLHYGDTGMLRSNYDGMKGYVKYMLSWVGDEGIMFSQAPEKDKPNRWINLGDWVAPGKLPPDEMVHTFYLWRCADIASKAARILGKYDDFSEYSDLAERTRSAFQKKFYNNEKGSYGPAGGNIFALKMGIPAYQKEMVVKSLEADIHSNGDHLDTGIFGTQFLFEVLSDNGLHELAYKIMNQTTKPSYGWWIGQGATTTWEQWDGGGSHNHPMFGGGLTWFYDKLAGLNIDNENPGYKHIIFRPMPADDLTSASYSVQTVFGTAAISWKMESGTIKTELEVPVGSTATLFLPADKGEIYESGEKIVNNDQVRFTGNEGNNAVIVVSSGKYSFTAPFSGGEMR